MGLAPYGSLLLDPDFFPLLPESSCFALAAASDLSGLGRKWQEDCYCEASLRVSREI
jgi:hypothetical protein